jgi:hypothetical protein
MGVVAGHALSHDPFSDERVSGPDLMPEGSSGSSANPLHDFLIKSVFLKMGRFNQEKTVQFSCVLLTVKRGTSNWSCGTPGGPGMTLWPKNKGGS